MLSRKSARASGAARISAPTANLTRKVNQLNELSSVAGGEVVVPRASCRRGQTAAAASGSAPIGTGQRRTATTRHAARAKIPSWNAAHAHRFGTQIVSTAKISRLANAAVAARVFGVFH